MDTRWETQMENEASHHIPPLMVFVALTLTAFFCVWIATLMGWIPQANAILSTPPPHSTPAQIAGNVPAGIPCGRCGVVVSVRKVEMPPRAMGSTAVTGSLIGPVMGFQTSGGGSFGGNLMTVLGVVIGALTGNRFEETARSTAVHQTTVRFDDGSSRVLTSAGTPAWAAGDRVKVINGRIQSNS